MKSGPVIFAAGVAAIGVFLFLVYDSTSSGAVTQSPLGAEAVTPDPRPSTLAAPDIKLRREVSSGPPLQTSRRTHIRAVICHVFGPNCQDAVAVARCETGGTFDIWAGYRKHQYWGLFQVSRHWRLTVPGFAWNAWSQARHAKRVHRLVGWSHWTCQP